MLAAFKAVLRHDEATGGIEGDAIGGKGGALLHVAQRGGAHRQIAVAGGGHIIQVQLRLGQLQCIVARRNGPSLPVARGQPVPVSALRQRQFLEEVAHAAVISAEQAGAGDAQAGFHGKDAIRLARRGEGDLIGAQVDAAHAACAFGAVDIGLRRLHPHYLRHPPAGGSGAHGRPGEGGDRTEVAAGGILVSEIDGEGMGVVARESGPRLYSFARGFPIHLPDEVGDIQVVIDEAPRIIAVDGDAGGGIGEQVVEDGYPRAISHAHGATGDIGHGGVHQRAVVQWEKFTPA